MTGDAFGPRFRASRRATACLALSASIAIAGCNPGGPPITTECVNSLSGEHAKVVGEQWGKKLRDAKGYEFWIDNNSAIWRCKDVTQ